MKDNPEWLVVVGVVVGGLARLAKTDRFTHVLARVGLPPVPKRALPWVAGGLGVIAVTVQAVVAGATWSDAVRAAILGLCSGALATWGHEAVVEGGRRGRELGVPMRRGAEPDDDDDLPPPSVVATT